MISVQHMLAKTSVFIEKTEQLGWSTVTVAKFQLET